jgi:hypothetical protein
MAHPRGGPVRVGILLVADVTGAPIRTVAWMAFIASTVC